MWDLYVIWFVVAVTLFTVEAITPGVFIFMFFGVGALVNGVITFFAPDFALIYQGLIFLVISIGSILLFRNQIRSKFFNEKKSEDQLKDDFNGKKVTAAVNFVNQVGTVNFNGSLWKAESLDEDVMLGEILIIKDYNNITLTVKRLK